MRPAAEIMQMASYSDAGSLGNWNFTLPGLSTKLSNAARTTSNQNFSPGDRLPIVFQNGDPNQPVVVTNENGTKKNLSSTWKSPWIPGSDPPQQDPSWKVGM